MRTRPFALARALASVFLLLGCSADVRIRASGDLTQGVAFRFVEGGSERPLSNITANTLAVESDDGLGGWRLVWGMQGRAVLGTELSYGEPPNGMTVSHAAEQLVARRRYRIRVQGSTSSAAVSVSASFVIDERGVARDEPRPAG